MPVRMLPERPKWYKKTLPECEQHSSMDCSSKWDKIMSANGIVAQCFLIAEAM